LQRLSRFLPLDAFKNHRELTLLDLDAALSGHCKWKRSLLQPLVTGPEPVAVPHDQLDAVLGPVEKREDVS
jgi:hypothetical protein